MNRRLPLAAIALALAAPAVPAAAQTWPAGVVAGVPRALPTAGDRPFVVLRGEDAAARKPTGVPPTDPRSRRPTLAQAGADDIPEVDIPARAEWTDDQGLRVSPTRLAYKRRF